MRVALISRMPELSYLHKSIKFGAVLSSEDDIFLSFGKTDVDSDDSKQEIDRDHDVGN